MKQKDALLAGAKQCLVEKGYGRTTARDIAEASGAHLGSIGYHYGSKDRLMNLAAIELSGEWGDTVSHALREAQGETPRDRLAAALAEISISLPRSRDVQSASLQTFAQAQFDQALHEEIVEGASKARGEFAALLAGEDEGAKDLPDAEAALGSLMYALVVGLVAQSLLDPDSVPRAEQMQAALDLLADDGD